MVIDLEFSFVVPGELSSLLLKKYQAPPSMGFSRQEYWNGLPFPSPGDLPNPGIKPTSPASCIGRQIFFTTVPPGKPPYDVWNKRQTVNLKI